MATDNHARTLRGRAAGSVPTGSNLLDALNEAGLNVPYSCRAGSCHACLVRCLDGPVDAKPEALALDKRAGWRLACQCRWSRTCGWRCSTRSAMACRPGQRPGLVRRCAAPAAAPERPVRYQAASGAVVRRCCTAYSLASLPGEDDFLEFHLDCQRPGAFATGPAVAGG
jgi:ferredoxin